MFSGLTFFGIPIIYFLRAFEVFILAILFVGIWYVIRAIYYSAVLHKRRKRAKIFQFPSKRI